MDRTHWIGCWRQHPGCALARIEQLEKAMIKIRVAALSAMNAAKELCAQLEINQILFEVERVEERE